MRSKGLGSKKTLTILSIVAGLIVGCTVIGWILTPSYQEIRQLARGSDRYLLDGQGRILQRIRTDFNKRRLPWVMLSELDPKLIETLLYIEDRRFYSHIGIDPIAIGRAVKTNLSGKRMQGASTITMQLSHLIRPDVLNENAKIPKRNWLAKAQQAVQALFIDLKWSKSEILEAYVNLVHLRSEFHGLRGFSLSFLGKEPQDMNAAEYLIFANLIRAPNRKLSSYQDLLCQQGEKLFDNFSCDSLAKDLNHFDQLKPQKLPSFDQAPQFAQRVFERTDKSEVASYIDRDLQKEVTDILRNTLAELQDRRVQDSAAVVIENSTGNILAYVGSIPEFSQAKDVDGANSPRQAGSTLKPFLYGRAIEKNLLTAASILRDEPTVFSWSGKIYRPRNYNNKFHGNVSLRQSLASSLNVPAVKMVQMLGLPESYRVISGLGFSDIKHADFYGASMALGAVEVRLHELANAYRSLYHGGQLKPTVWFAGQDVEATNLRTMSEPVSYIISDILSDPNARSMGFRWGSALETPFWSAVKTGTSKGLRDNWCVGFSEKYTVAVWAGNFSSRKMIDVSGVTGAGSSWHRIMLYLHRTQKSLAPQMPEGVVAKKIRHPWNSNSQTEYFVKGTEPKLELIEAVDKAGISIHFPAEDSTLTIDPRRKDPTHLFVKFVGHPPEKTTLSLNGKKIGEVVTSPFKVSSIQRGKHHIIVSDASGKVLDEVHFQVK